jgi:hypothetical protein
LPLIEAFAAPMALSLRCRSATNEVCRRVANIYYKDRLIIAYTSLNRSDKSWSPGAEITWKAGAERRSHTIGGLTDKFKSSEDAERFVVNLAKAWIDANP